VSFIFLLSALLSYSSFTAYVLKNVFNYLEYEFEFKKINTEWHPYRPYIAIEGLKILDISNKQEKLYFSKVESRFNLLRLFSFKPLESLNASSGSVTIDESSERISLPPSYQLNILYGMENINLRNISLNVRGVSSEVFVEKVYADLSSPSDSIFYASIKDSTGLGSLTISLESQFNQTITDSFLGEISMTQINFNDPLVKALCDVCSGLGKAEGLLEIGYLNNKLVNLSGEINLQSPGFLSNEGKLTAKIGLSNLITTSAFFIKSSYILEEKEYVLPNISLSLVNKKLKIEVPQFNLSDPFLQSQLNKIVPTFSRDFLLAGEIQNFTGIFSPGGEYLLSSNFTDIKLQDRLRGFSFKGLEGKLITSNQEKFIIRLDAPSLRIISEYFFDEEIIANSLKGDFYVTHNKGKYELINKSFSFYSGNSPFRGSLSFIPSSMDTLGDLTLFLELKDINTNKVSNFIPNLFVTKYIKSWIDNNIYCGNLNSAYLLYRGPADYKFTDSSSSFQMDFSLEDSCLALASTNTEEIALMGELDNTNFKGKIIKGDIFNSEIIADIRISRDINRIYNLEIEGKSHGPVSSIVDLYDSYNTSFIGKTLSGEHSTEFSFYAPLTNELGLLGSSSLLKVKAGISDTSLVLKDKNFLIKKLYSTIDFKSDLGFKKSSVSFNLNSIPLEFDISTEKIEKELRTVISSESKLKLSQLFSFHDYSDFLSGSSQFDIEFILPGYIRGYALTGSKVSIESELKGTAIKLFSPFKKDSKSEIVFKLDFTELDKKNQLKFIYGDILRGRFISRDDKLEGYIIAGPKKQSISVQANQIKLVGSFKEMDLRNLSKFKINSNSLSGNPFFIDNLNIGQVKLSSAIIIDTNINMKPSQDGPIFTLKNKDFSGSVLLRNNQEIDLNLDFLKLNINQTQEDTFFVSIFNNVNNPISFSVKSLLMGLKSYGSWSFKLLPLKDSLALVDIQGRYGRWGVAKNKDNLKSELLITKNSFGWDSKLKTRIYSGSPEKAFKQIGVDLNPSIGEIEFYPDIKWQGLPWDFEFNRIVGEVGLKIEDITIENKEADIEAPNNLLRLISIFNVTDTFEKVTSLDFRKLYRSGFSADTVEGNLYVDSKSLKTISPLLFKSGSSEFKWIGAVTKDKNGKFNILDLEVVMTLPLREYLPAYALILGGPLTAGVVYIAGKAFKRNLDKLSSGKWTISGSLEEPKTNFEGWFEE